MENANSKEYLEKIKVQVIENLKKTAHAPSVQLTDVPRTTLAMGDLSDYEDELDDLDEDMNADERVTMRMLDQRVARDDELDDSDNEEEGMNGARPQGANKRRNIMDYQNPNSVADDIEVDNKAEISVANTVEERVKAPSAEPKIEAEDVIMQDDTENTNTVEAGENEPSAALSGSPNADVDNDGDVDMEQTAAPSPPIQVPTPTSESHSPPPVAAADTTAATTAAPESAPPATEATAPAQDPIEAKEEGEDERQTEDVAAEESTEIAQQEEP